LCWAFYIIKRGLDNELSEKITKGKRKRGGHISMLNFWELSDTKSEEWRYGPLVPFADGSTFPASTELDPTPMLTGCIFLYSADTRLLYDPQEN
jgi:hypothetical protein